MPTQSAASSGKARASAIEDLKGKAPRAATAKKPSTGLAVDKVDTRYLQTLMGYNARRAALRFSYFRRGS